MQFIWSFYRFLSWFGSPLCPHKTIFFWRASAPTIINIKTTVLQHNSFQVYYFHFNCSFDKRTVANRNFCMKQESMMVHIHLLFSNKKKKRRRKPHDSERSNGTFPLKLKREITLTSCFLFLHHQYNKLCACSVYVWRQCVWSQNCSLVVMTEWTEQ